jgi:hypothetical protein
MRNIEEHFVVAPWVDDLLEVVLASLVPHGPMVTLGFNLVEDDDEDKLTIFPSPGDIVGACKNDGGRFYAKFSLEVLTICEAFSVIEGLEWGSPVGYDGVRCPELRISGRYQNRPVMLCVRQDPPSDALPSMRLDVHTGIIKPIVV